MPQESYGNVGGSGTSGMTVSSSGWIVGNTVAPTDAVTKILTLTGQDAYPQSTVNTAGGNVNIAGGIGRRFFTIASNLNNGGLAGKTVTLTANGTLVTLTATAGAAGAGQFGPIGTDDTAPQLLVTSTALALAISTDATLGPLMSAVASTANVYITGAGTLLTLTIATGTAGVDVTTTSGADGSIVVPVGSFAVPTIKSVNDASGVYFPVSAVTGAVAFGCGGAGLFGVFNNAFLGAQIPAGLPLTFTSGALYPGSNSDLTLRRSGAGFISLGAADGATAVPQSLGVQGIVAGTSNIAGALFTLKGSVSTGSGSGGPLKTQTAFPGAAATVQNTLSDRSFIGSGWTTLTNSSPVAFATMTYGASSCVAALLLYTIQANDATNYQSMSYYVQVNSVRKATGNTVSTIGVIGTPPAVAATSGTLTATFTVTDGASAATLNVTPVTSLTPTTLQGTFQVIANGPGLTIAPAGF